MIVGWQPSASHFLRPNQVAAKTPGKSKSEATLHAFEFLAFTQPQELPAVLAAIGPDDFLRRESIEHAIELSGVEPLSVARFEGDEAQWRDVNDELSTQSLFDTGGPKVVYIRKSDSFLSANRESIERWIEQAPPGSTLLMDLQSLPANQKVYKLASAKGRIVGTAEVHGKEFQTWIKHWGTKKHKVQLTDEQTGLIADRVGYVGGLIDCELAKLSLFADASGKIDDDRVDELVGGWRTQTVWKLTEAIAEGKIAEAIEGIDKLIMSGQNAVGIAAQMSWSLRRYAMAATWYKQHEQFGMQGVKLSDGLARAGFRPYDLRKEEDRLKRISWIRAKELLQWLVELEKKLKGTHSQEDRARIALESFIFCFQ